MDTLKLRRVGDSIVVTIPQDVLEQFGLREGDRLSLDRNADGIALRPERGEADSASAQRIMERYSRVLKRLAQ